MFFLTQIAVCVIDENIFNITYVQMSDKFLYIFNFLQILVYHDIKLKALTCERFNPDKSSVNFDYVRDKWGKLTNRELVERLLYDV